MENPAHHHEPQRGEALGFYLKSRVFIAGRWCRDLGRKIERHPRGGGLRGARPAGMAASALWTQETPAEFALTAGKVQNLRTACGILDGTEVPAGEVFSFWRQLGRTTRGRGFTTGRELRAGCMIPVVGGGLCQLSGLLYAAADAAGLEIVERHAHSRSLPGVELPADRDATVFWNYVDLRLRAAFDWRLEVRLSATDLVVTIRAAGHDVPQVRHDPQPGPPVRAAAEGDCRTCGVTSCFRHPSANRDQGAAAGHTAWLLDARWPEFDAWCRKHSRPDDRWQTPLDGHRWKKPNYAWTPPEWVVPRQATWETLRRSWRQRRLPAQGALRQRFLLAAQARLAAEFARRLDPAARHLVISQTLLPHLWRAGALGGRTFDVLLTRWPLADLQARLDRAAERHPESDTLTDFRADSELVEAETAALAEAARVATPHRRLAERFGARAILLEWEMPAQLPPGAPAGGPRWFFPASALARKGIHEVATAVAAVGGELLVLGRASEGDAGFLHDIPRRRAELADMARATAVVLPAWIEHEPRLLLRALALGVPVIASRDCGLMAHPLLTEIAAGDAGALTAAMARLTSRQPALPVR